MEEEEPFDFQRLNPAYPWTPLYYDRRDDGPAYGYSVDELLGCLSDMATRDTQRCTTAVEHLFMICPCFLPPVPPVEDRRSESDREEAALESLRKLSASIRESRLRRARRKRKAAAVVKTVDDDESEAAVKTLDDDESESAVATGAWQDDKIHAPCSHLELMDSEWLAWVAS